MQLEAVGAAKVEGLKQIVPILYRNASILVLKSLVKRKDQATTAAKDKPKQTQGPIIT